MRPVLISSAQILTYTCNVGQRIGTQTAITPVSLDHLLCSS